jgi:DNA-binding transcriptional LysR family regulator
VNQTAHFDLNLLRVFHAVHNARNVRRAAELLGLSQPAVSHSLTRLRLALKDPLFVRTAGGVAPTAKAEHFARFVEAALKTIDLALVETGRFDPARSERRYVMHMSDLGEGEFLPGLMEELDREAPKVRVEAIQLAGEAVLGAMEQGRIDLAVGYLPHLSGVHHQSLLLDRYVVLARRDHPAGEGMRTRKGLGKLDFVLVKSHAEPARSLLQLGLDNRIRLTVPHFAVLPEILARSDLVAIVPSRPGRRFAQQFGLQIAEPPLGLPPLEVGLHWYWRMHEDPGHRWMRELLSRLYGEPQAGRRRGALAR